MPFTDYDGDVCRSILNTLWTNSLIGLAIVDADGRFIKANPVFCEYLEYSEAELVGNPSTGIRAKTFMEVTLPDDVEFDKEMVRRVVEDNEIHGYDMPKRYLTKFHNVIKVLLRATGVMKKGEFMFFVAQASLLEKPTIIPTAIEAEKKRFKFWSSVRTNWTIIMFTIAVLTAVLTDSVKELLKHF